MDRSELRSLLEEIRGARVAVIGDFALDVYWFIHQSSSELSLETGKPTQRVTRQRFALGGAGNVCCNLAALGASCVHALGVVGPDPWGTEMLRLLQEEGVNTDHMLAQREQWATVAFAKPHIGGEEQRRLDFGHFNVPSDETIAALLDRLDALLPSLDVIIINQQVRVGLHSDAFREELNCFVLAHPGQAFIVDSRDYSDSYSHAHLKVNEKEAVRLARLTKKGPGTISSAAEAADALFRERGRPVFVTRGEHGCVVRDEGGLHKVPAVPVEPPIDSVGAGDSMLAAIAAALAVGSHPLAAARLGALAAAVTVKKLFQTGTAAPDEILAVAPHDGK